MRLHTKNKWLFLVLPFLLFSCASKKEMIYFQGIDNAPSYESSENYESKLQPDDLLKIIVYAENPEVATPFNQTLLQGNQATANSASQDYLVDASGAIDFPIIGKIKVAGLTTKQARDKIFELVSEYIKNPTINLKIMNYKVSVLGEVTKPGVFSIQSQRISVLEALTLAGDLTIYGKRQNILIIHEEDNKKTYTRIDITKPDFLTSPSYYLSQNDVVFVEPNSTRINGSVVGPNTSVILSVVSILITVSVILFRN